MILFLLLISSALATSPATPPVDPSAAQLVGNWVNGKRKLIITPKGYQRITVKTDGKFEGEASARESSVLVADQHKWGKPTDDLTTTCALDLTKEAKGIRVKMEGDKADCDANYEGFYTRSEMK